MGNLDSRRERKKQETRQRLLECAWRLFREKGIDQATVEDITEAADVAKSTFFNYFATKEAIVSEIALWRIELLGSRVLGAPNVPEGAVARIKLVMQAMADEFSPERELTQHIFLARIGAPVDHKSVQESAHRIGSLIQELVVQGQARGEIRDDVQPGLVARLLMTCLFYHFSRWRHTENESPEEAKLVQSVDVLMCGLNGTERRTA
ncbi:MAG: TetR/AcrR family transcriptional regulator [Anaerolineae bacterium]|nr:TetR/AcrR family transcriptional regulator [Anaerolineae bacterium]